MEQTSKPEAGEAATGTWLEWFKVGIPVILLAGVAFAVAWHFVKPAPPSHVVIAAGSKSGMYYKFAQEYARYFAENGITLEVKETAGSIENYKLLTAPDSGVDVAIVQGGIAPPPDQRPELQAVAGVFYEPIWVFYRSEKPISKLTDLAGRRIAIGAEGSGTRPLALKLLNEAGIATSDDKSTTLSDLGSEKAAEALKAEQIDAMFTIIAPGASVITSLLQIPGVHLMTFEHANAYGRIHPYLAPVTVYEGSLDIARNRPQKDANVIAATACIVIRRSTHQSIIQLLVGAAQQVHAGPTLVSAAGVFPSVDGFELPRNKDAHYFLTNKPGFLQRTFPFWLASLIDRLLIMLLPLLAVFLPLVRMMPPLYKWRIRSRIYRWYKQVRAIDERLNENSTPAELAAGQTELTKVEQDLLTVKVPLSYMEELYNMRMHAAYVQGRVQGWMKAKSAP